MKKFILTIALFAMFASTYATTISPDKIPTIIKANFVSEYPEAKVIRWESTDELDYKVEFQIGESYGAAYYNSEGHLMEDDRVIQWNEVPQEGRMEIYHLGESKIVDVIKITNANKEIHYQVIVKKNLKTQNIILNNEGHIIRKY